MVNHMNEDHLDAMQAILEAHYGIRAEHIEMVSASPEGCTLQTQQGNFYLPYSKVCQSTQDARMELVKLTKKARKALTASAAFGEHLDSSNS